MIDCQLEERITFSYKTITIQVVKNDILKEKVQCIVNPIGVFPLLGGLSRYITINAGLELEILGLSSLIKSGGIKTGDAISTSAGKLPFQYIIHAVGPVFKEGKDNEDKGLENAIVNSYKKCNGLGLTSIAIPAISSGFNQFPKTRCAKIMLNATKKFIDEIEGSDHSIRLIRLTNIDEDIISRLEEEAEKFIEDPEKGIKIEEYREFQYGFGWGLSK